MKETQAIIQRVKQVNDTHQHIVLAVDELLNTMKPGQSLLARETEKKRGIPTCANTGGPSPAVKAASRLSVPSPRVMYPVRSSACSALSVSRFASDARYAPCC